MDSITAILLLLLECSSAEADARKTHAGRAGRYRAGETNSKVRHPFALTGLYRRTGEKSITRVLVSIALLRWGSWVIDLMIAAVHPLYRMIDHAFADEIQIDVA